MTLHTCRMLATLFLLVTCSVVSAFDAVLNRGAGVAVLFADGQFIRFNLGQWRGSDGYPKPVDSTSWPGITEGPIDAAINWGNGKAYLFRGREYFRYDLSEGVVDKGYPKPINDKTWPGLGFATVDAAINWGNGKAYFFSGDRYVRYDLRGDRADSGYPKAVNDRTWPGIGMERVDAAFNAGNGRAYLFAQGRFSRYDIYTDKTHPGHPRPLDDASFPGAAAFATGHVGGQGSATSSPVKQGSGTPSNSVAAFDAGLLVGVWQALTDPNEIVSFDGSLRRSLYEGEETESNVYKIQSSCDGTRDTGSYYIVTDDDFCFVIVTLNKSRLDVSMIGGRGNTLTYKRLSSKNQ